MNQNSRPPSREPYTRQSLPTLLFCILALGFLLWLTLRHAVGILTPFLLAGLLAALIRPWVERLHRITRIPRGVWSAVLVLLTVGGMGAITVGGVRRGIRELSRLAEELAADTEGLTAAVDKVLSRVESLSAHIPFLRRFEDAPFYEELCAGLDGMVEAAVTRLTESVTSRIPDMAMSLAGFLPAAFIFITVTLLACYYFTADNGRLAPALRSSLSPLLPESLRDRLPPLGRRLARLGKQYLRACLLLGLMTFLLSFIGLAILRVPYAFILALLLAAVDLLPLLGTGLVLIPWAVVSLLLGQIKLGIGLLILYGITSVTRQILEPKLIGDGLGLHPLFSLLAMYAGLQLFGVPGMILAPLIAAGIKSATSS